MAEPIHPTERTRLHRQAHKASFDRTVVNSILDEALFAHVGFVGSDGQPYVLPTLHVRLGDKLLLHGSSAGRMVREVSSGAPVCLSATVLDGLVLARAAFGQSMNYRSVVVLASGIPITDTDRKLEVLRAVTDKILPGRWEDIRHPTPNELKATAVVEFPIEEASAKVRTGPADDIEEDLRSGRWGGVIPIWTQAGRPEPDDTSAGVHDVPPYVEGYVRAQAERMVDGGGGPRSRA